MSHSSKHLLRLVALLLLLKLAYFGLLCGAMWLGKSDFEFAKFQTMMVRWPRSGPPIFASRFATWDSAHYLYLSEVGYRHGVPSCAFYPLWPLLVRWASPLFGGSDLLAGTIIANLISLSAWIVFYQLVVRRWDEIVAKWSLVFLIAFPGSLFFQFNYSESLFLLLTLTLWWALTEKRLGWSLMSAFMLPLTRGPGAFAVLPITWSAVLAVGRRLWPRFHEPPGSTCTARLPQTGACWVPFGPAWGVSRTTLRSACLLCAPLLGWGAYLCLMWHWTGDPFEGVRAQKYWGVHSVSNLINVPKFLIGLFTPTEWHDFQGSLLDRCVFIMLLYCLPLLWRVDKELLVWIYMLGILPAMSGTFTSFTRFASCAFPLFIALGVLLGKRQWRWPRYALLAAFVLLHAVLLWRFVNFRWAG